MALPDLHGIYFIDHPFLESDYIRRWVIVRLTPLRAAPISSAFDLYDPTKHFLIEDSHPDFPACGLVRTSFVYHQAFAIEEREIQRKKGDLKGDLLAEFIAFTCF